MEPMDFSQYTGVCSKYSAFNACSSPMSYFFIASSLMNILDVYFYRTSSPSEILNMSILDRICAAIVGMNCNVLCAFLMYISLLGSGCFVAPVFRSRLKVSITGGRD